MKLYFKIELHFIHPKKHIKLSKKIALQNNFLNRYTLPQHSLYLERRDFY